MAEGEDRTEAPSPKRLQRAREAGQVALSRELPPAAALAAAALVLALVTPRAARALVGALALLLQDAGTLEPTQALAAALRAAIPAVVGFAVAGVLASVLSVMGQTGFLVRLAALQPSLARLDLRRNLGRIVGPAGLLELGKSVAKAALVGFALWQAAATLRPWLAASLAWEPAAMPDAIARLLLRLLLAALLAQGTLAALDVVRARAAHARSLRMSRHELREEQRESDGDPRIKARIRRLRLTRARRRMLAAIPTATVVVTNPTHYAVALAYTRGSGGAPRVVAKGVDAMAARIRELAEAARVPLVANPPLARALWRVELDTEVPAALFQAVAEIIAYVWRLRTPARAPSG